jgi:hypothetical protein
MKRTRAVRPLPLFLTALVALFSALAALAVTDGGDARAHGDAAYEATAPRQAAHSSAVISRKELKLRNGMRQLWEDHIVWTRLAIISLTTNSPDTEATVARLLQNQTDIGDAVKPFYGRRAGERLTALLKEHIAGAVDLLKAAKAGDNAKLGPAKDAWYRNGDQIARFLSHANPKHWRFAKMRGLMRGHLDQTLEEAVARLKGDFAADIAAYDEIHRHILMMADTLSSGIVKQFPRRFR